MNKAILAFFVLCVLVFVSAREDGECKELHPVVLVPGIMGTVLDATADFPSDVKIPSECPHKFKDQLIWIDIFQVINYKCLKTFFQSDYNPSSKKWETLKGIEFTVPKWGTVYASDVLAPGAATEKLVPYYHHMIQKFEEVGYKDGETIVAGGFDWKQLPTSEWIQKMKDLIEGMVKKTGRKAVVIAHSMGGPYTYYFFNEMGTKWVEENIYMYIPMAPAYMGAVKALEFMLVGLDRNVPICGKYFAPLMRHIPSLWFLLPWKDAYKGKILATTPSKTYTFDDLEKLLNDGNASYVEGKLAATQGVFFNKFKNYDTPPKVPIRGFYGYGKNTCLSLKFKEDIKPHDPDGTWESCTRIEGDGDGTVPTDSIKYIFDKWKNKGADIEVFSYSGMGHLPLIKENEVIRRVLDLICD